MLSIRIVFINTKTSTSPQCPDKFSVYDKLMGILKKGFLEVKQKKITIVKIEGGTNDEILLELTKDRYQDRFYLDIELDLTSSTDVKSIEEGELASEIKLNYRRDT